MGLDYLSLDRAADTFSGGEAQRIRLASQIGSGLVGVMYILDEPSIGLHQRDNQRLLDTLDHLRDLGNTVLVVEHDREAIRRGGSRRRPGPGRRRARRASRRAGHARRDHGERGFADRPISFGPARRSRCRAARREFDPQLVLEIQGARGNNLKNVDRARFPSG